MISLRGPLLGLCLCSLPLSALAESFEPFPEPLTLEYALSLAEQAHPEVLSIQAARTQAEAERAGALANNAISATVEGRLRWVGPASLFDEDSTDDHKLSLFLRKPLYDFGRSSANLNAAELSVQGGDYRYQVLLVQRRLHIMEAFFQVLLADMAYDRDMEGMAMAYIRFDRLRTRQELGQASDIEVLEAERSFEQARHQLSLSNGEQRARRARLANLLDRPGMLPSSLARPALDSLERKLPEFDGLFAEAVQNNPRILALEAQLSSAQQRMAAASAEGRPRLDGELEASHYTRELGSTDRWRAGVYLTVPIYSGGRVDAGVAAQRAKVYEAQAKLELARYQLRQQLLDSWLGLQALRLQRGQALSEQRYRDLYLDRSRANYEMEVRSDLGDSMVRLSEAQLAVAEANYRIELAWQELDLLLGKGPGVAQPQ
ncbi:MAG: TolC family protein [Thiohalomonadaceae bacterium]